MTFVSNSRVRLTLLLLALAAALVLRLIWLDSIPLWWDEFVTLGRARLPIDEIWRSLSFQGPSDSSLDSSPPLLHMIVHWLLAWGGSSEAWVKLPGALAGALTCLALYPLGTRLFGGRSGLYASALLAMSLYHVHYSREVRPYSLYLLLAMVSLWLLLRALEGNRFRQWAAYALAAAATLYASYLGGASLVAQGVFAVFLVAARRMPKGRAVPAFLSLGAAAALYLPWLPGHLFHMELIYAPEGSMGLSWEFLRRAMLEFTAGSSLYLGAAAVGVMAGLYRNISKTALVLIWLGTPLAAALALRTGIAVNPRYLMNFVPGLALLAGAGIDALVRGLSLALPGRAAALLGLLAAMGLCWPGVQAMPDYFRRDNHSVRDDLLSVARSLDNVDVLAFPRNRHLKVFTRWYLPGVAGELGQSGDLRYRRVMLLCGPEFAPAWAGKPEQHGDLRAFRLGILNVSPLAGTGPYRADFSGFDAYREAAFWDNVGPDLFRHSLTLFDPGLPGRMIWQFAAPEGGFAGPVPLTATLRLTRSRATPPPDATATILAGDSLQSLKPLATMGQADFKGGELTLRLTVPAPSGPSLVAGVALDPGAIHGGIEVADFRLDFPGVRPVPSLPPDLAGGASIVPWKAGLARTGDASLVAFALDDPALAGFKAAYPGIEPVAALADRLVFDPQLFRPRVSVPGGDILYAAPELKGVTARGVFEGQRITFGSLSLVLPKDAPEGAALELTPARGRLWASIDYSNGPGNPFTAFNVTPVPGEAAVTCSGENACFVTYALRSGAPVRRVRVAYTPEVYGEPGMENGVRLKVSTDGTSYRQADAMIAKDSELWEGGHRRVAVVELDKPSDRVYLRFELTSDRARLKAGKGSPMTIDAWLDPALPLPAALPGGELTPGSDGAGVDVYLSPRPLPDLDRLQPGH